MTNLNLGQDVAYKRERKQTAAHIVAKVVRMRRYRSLININPSEVKEVKAHLPVQAQLGINSSREKFVQSNGPSLPIEHSALKKADRRTFLFSPLTHQAFLALVVISCCNCLNKTCFNISEGKTANILRRKCPPVNAMCRDTFFDERGRRGNNQKCSLWHKQPKTFFFLFLLNKVPLLTTNIKNENFSYVFFFFQRVKTSTHLTRYILLSEGF